MLQIAQHDSESYCGIWTWKNWWQLTCNVMSLPTCHFHRLPVRFLSVPVICGGNNLRNYLTNWRLYFIYICWKEIEWTRNYCWFWRKTKFNGWKTHWDMKFLCFLENLLSRKHVKRSMYITQEYYGTELFCHLRCSKDVSSGFNCKLV